jgi:hypothetical protein
MTVYETWLIILDTHAKQTKGGNNWTEGTAQNQQFFFLPAHSIKQEVLGRTTRK